MKKLLHISIITLTFVFGFAETKLFAQTYYWVGQPTPGTVTKWSDAVNWVIPNPDVTAALLTPRITPLTAPGITNDVVFDASSFDPTTNPNIEVVIDENAFCKSMNWTGAGLYSPILSGNKDLTIAGSLTFVPEMTVSFSGKVNFTGTGIITSAGKTFLGDVTFSVGTWQLADNFSASDKVTVSSGTLEDKGFQINGVSGKAFTLGSGARLHLTRTPDAFPANFTPALDVASTVEYGSTSTQIVKGFSGGGNASYGNLILSGNSTKTLSANTIVRNSLTINAGTLADGGFQLNGSTTGTAITIRSGATLSLGSTTATTTFPNFTTNTFETGSTVAYVSANNQIVRGFSGAGTSTYSNLIISGGATKQLNANTTVRGDLTIGPNTTLSDQIFTLSGNATGTMTMEAGSQINLFAYNGLTSPNSPMPAFAAYNLDAASTVNYASNQPQGIRALAGSGNNSYANLTLANSLTGTSTVTKTLAGNILVRGNLTISTRDILDVSASNRNIEVQGNWVNSGTFTQRTGTVTFSGNSNSVIGGTTSTNFYNLTFNKASKANTITLTRSATVLTGGTATFTMGIVKTATTYADAATIMLIFNDDANIIGASHNSHVDGYIRMYALNDNGKTFIYPIGNGIAYRPAGFVAGNNALFTFDARYINRVTTGDTQYSPSSVSSPLQSVSKYEYWHVERVEPNSSSRALISWEMPISGGGDLNGGGQSGYLGTWDKMLTVAYWNGTSPTSGSWTDNGRSNTELSGPSVNPSTTKGTMTAQNSTNGNKQYFTIGSIINALPVELISFKAKAVNGQVVLDWQSGKETNVSHYEVERSSADMNNFQAIKQVKAKGESTALVSYTAVDANPVSGLAYYRLKMVDKDGTFEYSKTVSVQLTSVSASPAAVTLYPNPSNGRSINFNIANNDSPMSLQLFDLMGKPLNHTITESNNGFIAVQFSETLPTGMYVAVLTNTANQQKTQVRYIVK